MGHRLQRVITWYELLAIGVGGILGTSWVYLNTRFYAEYGPGGVTLGFFVATIMATFVAFSYAELASSIKREGGEIVFAYAAFGLKGAFLAGWSLFTAYTTCVCFYVPAAGYLLDWFIPQLNTIKIWTVANTPVYLPSLSVGLFFLIFFFLLNYKGVKLASLPQFYMTTFLMGLGIMLFFVALTHGSVGNIRPLYVSEQSPFKSTIRFTLLAMTYLTGFSALAMFGEESNVDERTFGRMIVLSVGIAGIFYILMMCTGAMLMPWQDTIKLEKGMIDEFFLLYRPLGIVAWLISFFGMLTSLNGLMLAASRTIFVMGRAGILPKAFCSLHERYRTPQNALISVLVIAIIFGMLGKRAMIWLLDIAGIGIGIAWTLSILSMLALRRRYPRLKRPYKAPLVIVTAPISLIIVTIVFIVSIMPGTPLSLLWPYEYGILLIWIILGIIVYIFCQRRWRNLDEEWVKKRLFGEYYENLKRV